MTHNSFHFFPATIILLFSIGCQNCSTTNADNKKSNSDNICISGGNPGKSKQDTISKKDLLGKVIPAKDTNFIEVGQIYCGRKGVFLRKEAYTAFKKMFAAAHKDGIKLTILSATRTFIEQKGIWEGKWTGKVLYYGKNIATCYPDHVERSKYVLHYSSMPGTSRHHWGTDMDLNSLELAYYKTETGKKMYNWLVNNASGFGFCQPYTAMDTARTTGYEEEKWHWSYYPVSSIYYRQYKEKITYDDLKGFEGCETAKLIDVIKNYVLSVNKKCH